MNLRRPLRLGAHIAVLAIVVWRETLRQLAGIDAEIATGPGWSCTVFLLQAIALGAGPGSVAKSCIGYIGLGIMFLFLGAGAAPGSEAAWIWLNASWVMAGSCGLISALVIVSMALEGRSDGRESVTLNVERSTNNPAG